MTGIITVRHAKVLKYDNAKDLLLRADEFLKKYEANYITGNHGMTLRDLLRVMVVNTFHHLFFLDEAGRVSNVVTLGDVVAYLFPT